MPSNLEKNGLKMIQSDEETQVYSAILFPIDYT